MLCAVVQNMMGELEQQHSIIGGLQHDLENHRRRGHDLAYQVCCISLLYLGIGMQPVSPACRHNS